MTRRRQGPGPARCCGWCCTGRMAHRRRPQWSTTTARGMDLCSVVEALTKLRDFVAFSDFAWAQKNAVRLGLQCGAVVQCSWIWRAVQCIPYPCLRHCSSMSSCRIRRDLAPFKCCGSGGATPGTGRHRLAPHSRPFCAATTPLPPLLKYSGEYPVALSAALPQLASIWCPCLVEILPPPPLWRAFTTCGLQTTVAAKQKSCSQGLAGPNDGGSQTTFGWRGHEVQPAPACSSPW